MAITINVTLGDIIHSPNPDAWDKFCDLRGWCVWILNEGKAETSETVDITIDEAIEYGLLGKEF